MTAVQTCRAQYPTPPNPMPNTRTVHCDLPTGHDSDHEETDTGNTWPQEAVTTPASIISTRLIYRSPNGRVEVAVRDGDQFAISVLRGKDMLNLDEGRGMAEAILRAVRVTGSETGRG